jgi:transcriptional regulator with GAF, ATPase, and Fis domain
MEPLGHSAQDELVQARETIARQAEEIERLQRQVASNQFADGLRERLRLAATTGVIAAPVTHSQLLELIVATAAQVINADAASLFLVDAEHDELIFEVALGQKADAAKQLRLPLGKGIAGLVAVTGQPMAVSDAQDDPRHAPDIAATIGHHPKNLLCVPMIVNDEVIGVLELLDKRGAPSFGPSDIAALALFANQAAVAIEQSQTQGKLADLLAQLITESAVGTDEYADQLENFAADIERDPHFLAALDLAHMLRDIAQRGEPEMNLCSVIVRGVLDYVRSRSFVTGLDTSA